MCICSLGLSIGPWIDQGHADQKYSRSKRASGAAPHPSPKRQPDDLLAGEARLGEGGRDERCFKNGCIGSANEMAAGTGSCPNACCTTPSLPPQTQPIRQLLLWVGSLTLGEAEAGEESESRLHP